MLKKIGKSLFFILQVLVIMLMPFILLIRGSVLFHHRLGSIPYIALLGGFAMCFVLLYFYFTVIHNSFINRKGNWKRRAALVLIILGIFGAYSMVFLSKQQFKDKAIQKEYRSLHPILRLSISTLALVDPGTIITDASRVPEDYSKWGLPTNSRSLHFKQKDGFAYAVDLRTKGRSGFRNAFTKWSLKAMGMKVIRHGGTADHFHVSLWCPFAPNSF